MTTLVRFAAVLAFATFLAAGPAARAQESPGRSDGPDAGVSPFVYRAPASAPPTIAPLPPIEFTPPVSGAAVPPGWFLRSVTQAATDAIADFRLRVAPAAAPAPPLDELPTAAVPEPSAALLVLLGGALVVLLVRRGRSAAR